jgi:glutathione S-transferase
MPFFMRPIVRTISTKARKTFIDPQLELHRNFMEGELGKSTWFAGGEFTAADIQMSFPVEAAAARGGLDSSQPKLWAYLQRIHARPAYQRALQKGGPFELMR